MGSFENLEDEQKLAMFFLRSESGIDGVLIKGKHERTQAHQYIKDSHAPVSR